MLNEKRSILEIDMQKLMLTYLNRWWLLLIGTVVAVAIALVCTANFITPMYTASVTVYVNSTKTAEEEVTYISASTLSAAQRLVNTYIKIIESDSVLSKVAEASGLDISGDDIRAAMSASQVDNTELFKVRITHRVPERAAQIANAVAEVAPGEIEGVIEGSSTKIIDYAKVPNTPSSPNAKKNGALGGIIGFLLVLIYLTVHFLLDVRIKDEDELTTLFDAPVLGQIPVFGQSSGRRHSTEKNAYEVNEAQQEGGAR